MKAAVDDVVIVVVAAAHVVVVAFVSVTVVIVDAFASFKILSAKNWVKLEKRPFAIFERYFLAGIIQQRNVKLLPGFELRPSDYLVLAESLQWFRYEQGLRCS